VARGVNYLTISRRRELAGLKHHPEKGLPSGVIQIDPLAGGSDFFVAADLR
jgi:hypothetical protein